MDWIQFLTNLLAVGTPMAGTVYIFYSITSNRIDRMEEHHREDMIRMDDKWERLFEKLLINEKSFKKVKQ